MLRSEERVLVTHVGSLPRAAELLELLLAREAGGEYDAERLDRLQAVGVSEIVRRQRVIAGADCGFASFAATVEFMPEIVWAKLEALAEGARRASARLWQ